MARRRRRYRKNPSGATTALLVGGGLLVAYMLYQKMTTPQVPLLAGQGTNWLTAATQGIIQGLSSRPAGTSVASAVPGASASSGSWVMRGNSCVDAVTGAAVDPVLCG